MQFLRWRKINQHVRELMERFGIQALPSTLVIGRDGRVVLVESNYYRGTPEKLLKATSGW